jgi:hypothetical protein
VVYKGKHVFIANADEMFPNLTTVSIRKWKALKKSGSQNRRHRQADHPVEEKVDPLLANAQRLLVLQRIVQSCGAILQKFCHHKIIKLVGW